MCLWCSASCLPNWAWSTHDTAGGARWPSSCQVFEPPVGSYVQVVKCSGQQRAFGKVGESTRLGCPCRKSISAPLPARNVDNARQATPQGCPHQDSGGDVVEDTLGGSSLGLTATDGPEAFHQLEAVSSGATPGRRCRGPTSSNRSACEVNRSRAGGRRPRHDVALDGLLRWSDQIDSLRYACLVTDQRRVPLGLERVQIRTVAIVYRSPLHVDEASHTKHPFK